MARAASGCLHDLNYNYMINANELRIGNQVLESHDQMHTVTASSILAQYQHDIAKVQDYKPIPLTEEILMKCGFIQQPSPFSGVFVNNSISLVGDYNDRYRVVGYKLVFHTNAGTTEAKVKHLHQLQNLYFALTSKELVYTP